MPGVSRTHANHAHSLLVTSVALVALGDGVAQTCEPHDDHDASHVTPRPAARRGTVVWCEPYAGVVEMIARIRAPFSLVEMDAV